MQSWFFLGGAILLEVAGTTCMKLSEGFTKLVPSVLIFVFYGFAFGALTLALRHLDVSVAYAIWAGVGTALIAGIGAAFFNEAMGPVKIASVAFIVVGVVGIHLGK